MKNSAMFILLLFVSSFGFGQTSDFFALWPDTVLAKANSAKDVDYMNDNEKEAVMWTNLVRINPALFCDTYLKDYLKENGLKKDKAIRDLMSELKETSPRSILQPHPRLTEFAREHAKDMGESGRTGHRTSSGESYSSRVSHMTDVFSHINENCNYGNALGKDAVMDLLIDRNVPNVGHRKNILDPNMGFIGIAIEPHKRWRHNCVQEFGKKLP